MMIEGDLSESIRFQNSHNYFKLFLDVLGDLPFDDGTRELAPHPDNRPLPLLDVNQPELNPALECGGIGSPGPWMDDQGRVGMVDPDQFISEFESSFALVISGLHPSDPHLFLGGLPAKTELRKKGRQGRSRAVRERERIRREKEKEFRSGIEDGYGLPCKGCRKDSSLLVYDHQSGDTICSNCGMVLDQNGQGDSNRVGFGFQFRFLSKPYDRLVHFQQRIAQLTTRDPKLPDWFIDSLGEFLNENGETIEGEFGNPRSNWGIESWKRIMNHPLFRNYLELVGTKPKRRILPNHPSKLAIHWLQIRRRLGIEPWKVEFDFQTLNLLRIRYRLISLSFNETLRKPGPGQSRLPIHDQNQSLSRKNILNVNYVLAQLLRIVNPELWRDYAKFIPQLESSTQPEQNNQRWRIIMDWCRDHFPSQESLPDPLDWPFYPITNSELENEFKFFY